MVGANGFSVTEAAGVVTLDLGQDLRPTAFPTFGEVNIKNGTAIYTLRGFGGSAGTRAYVLPQVTAGAQFVMTQGAQTLVGIKTFTDAPVFSSTTLTSLLSVGAAKALQSVILANANGCNASFAGSTLTLSMLQDLSTTGSPTFAGVTASGLTASTLLASTAGKALQSVIFANANGCNASFTGSTLTLSMLQDVSTTGSPTFAGLTASGLTATTLLSAGATKALQSVTLANLNGCNASFAGTDREQAPEPDHWHPYICIGNAVVAHQPADSWRQHRQRRADFGIRPARVITIPAGGASRLSLR